MYQAGVATSVVDLITQWKDFLVGEGWTVSSFATLGTGKRLHISKDGLYIHQRAYLNESTQDIGFTDGQLFMYAIFGYSSNGYNAGSLWDEQPGGPTYMDGLATKTLAGGVVALNTSSIPYHFFAFDAPEVAAYCIVEYPTGIYQHLWYAKLKKFGSWGGGEFSFGANYPNSVTRRNVVWPGQNGSTGGVMLLRLEDFDGFTGQASNIGYKPSPGNPRLTDFAYIFKDMHDDAPNGFNSLNPLNGYGIWCTRAGPVFRDGGWNPQLDPISELGYLPELFSVNTTGLLPAGQYPFTATGATYRVFPITRNSPNQNVTDTANPPHSRAWGVAIRDN